MTQLNPAERTDSNPDASPGEPPLGADDGAAKDDWDAEPEWRKVRDAMAEPGAALSGLDAAEITQRHVGMINELIEQTHPLASEYLASARTITPGAPGRERTVHLGCKLAKATNQLIATAERLAKGGS